MMTMKMLARMARGRNMISKGESGFKGNPNVEPSGGDHQDPSKSIMVKTPQKILGKY